MFEFLQSISDFFQVGIYEWFKETAAYFMQTLIIWWIKCQIWGITFAWEIAGNILQALNINAQINAAFGGLPPQVISGMQFFKIPEGLNLLITAGMTRFVLGFIPGL